MTSAANEIVRNMLVYTCKKSNPLPSQLAQMNEYLPLSLISHELNI